MRFFPSSQWREELRPRCTLYSWDISSALWERWIPKKHVLECHLPKLCQSVNENFVKTMIWSKTLVLFLTRTTCSLGVIVFISLGTRDIVVLMWWVKSLHLWKHIAVQSSILKITPNRFFHREQCRDRSWFLSLNTLLNLWLKLRKISVIL